MSNSIVIVGGGFAAFWAAIAARRAGADAVEVTVISPSPHLQMRPRLYEARPEELSIDMQLWFDLVDVRYLDGEASGVDSKAVCLADGTQVGFDRLVIATGSTMRRPQISGAEQAHSIDTQAEAIAFDQALMRVARRKAPVIALLGAGFTGIELATALRDRIAHHAGEERAQAAEVILIDRSHYPGASLGEGPRAAISEALAQARVNLRLGIGPEAIAPDGVRLADGSFLAADLTVMNTGLVASPFTLALGVPLDPLGRVRVGSDLRTIGRHDWFAAGDAAAADTGDGNLTMMSCQHALQTGRFAGENAARDLIGLPVLTYAQPTYGTCLDLGRFGAVMTRGWERTPVMVGAEAAEVKRRINRKLIYPPPACDAATLLRVSSTEPALQSA